MMLAYDRVGRQYVCEAIGEPRSDREHEAKAQVGVSSQPKKTVTFAAKSFWTSPQLAGHSFIVPLSI